MERPGPNQHSNFSVVVAGWGLPSALIIASLAQLTSYSFASKLASHSRAGLLSIRPFEPIPLKYLINNRVHDFQAPFPVIHEYKRAMRQHACVPAKISPTSLKWTFLALAAPV